MTSIHSNASRRPARLLVVALMAASLGQAFAQDAQRRIPIADGEFKPALELPAPAALPGDLSQPGPKVPPGQHCPHPVGLTLTAQSGPATQVASDFPSSWNVAGAVFNDTQTDRQFGHTFVFKVPEGKCCQANDGRLVVTYRALTTGRGHQSTDAGNDAGGPVRNGVALNNMQPGGYNYIWPAGGVAQNQTVTRSYAIPASWVASGRVSFIAQDDTAVVKAVLMVSGCCVTPIQPEK
jgi:hypothetical protein